MTDLTELLKNVDRDGNASDKILPMVYDELRKLAAAKMAKEKPGQTLEATALVHEAYMRLVGPNNTEHWNGQSHFFGAAAEAMRRILIDNARKRQSQKHGGIMLRHTLGDPDAPEQDEDLIALDEALTKLAAEDKKAASVVEMRYFAGMSHEEIATALDITIYRARQKWTYARAWLRRELEQ
ncbi:MAG: ECF-type sigma factor [Planctomycetota bacterium]